ncbi:hypothetical protein TRAPUB_6767 [Trametes pubescens]|uniref:Protein kinase domain-containing protein n=1 Tax=Trametes pubescens TaxID=154538 RepID=A0A1M2V555_TRAPU|nr:hypothetical protein TRAPUB_6767 [Trametes pubescens]
MASEEADYPWYVREADGSIDFCGIPDRLLRHPELQRRGIVPTDVLKPGTVYRTLPMIEPVYVVKILNPSMEELAIYQRLLRELKRSNNHTVPCEVTLNGHPLLIMPSFDRLGSIHGGKQTAPALIDIIFQLVEGLEFLHSLRIVHMDMCPDNVIAANHHHTTVNPSAVEDRLYIIDFDSSRQFTLGPGVQRAITLPETQIEPPNGLTHFDPYSWDVYCTGRTHATKNKGKLVQNGQALRETVTSCVVTTQHGLRARFSSNRQVLEWLDRIAMPSLRPEFLDGLL